LRQREGDGAHNAVAFESDQKPRLVRTGKPGWASACSCCAGSSEREIPRTFPSAEAAVGTPRTREPLADGKTYLKPWDRNSMSADRLTLFSPLAIWSSPESALRFRDFDTSDGEMKRLSAKFLDGTCGSFWMASFRRSATSWRCMVVAQITNLEIGNLFIWQPTNAGGAPQEN
jgi:hypothetical protein